MFKIDGAYLYELGAKVRPIGVMKEEDCRKIDVFFPVNAALQAITDFLNNSAFSESIRNLHQSAQDLSEALENMNADLENTNNFKDPVTKWAIINLKAKFRQFEAVLLAELQNSPLYLVGNKGGFDVLSMTNNGAAMFPKSLPVKVPQAMDDVSAGARCLAFELFTAAGFHFHRANESVLRRYFDEVASVDQRPKSRNIGDYLRKMADLKVGDPKVIEVLKGLKDLHRNPLMHPDDSIESEDEALSLYAAIRAAIGYMLDRIAGPTEPAVT